MVDLCFILKRVGPRQDLIPEYHDWMAPGFDHDSPDLSEANEILPDLIFTPGTQVEYYYQGYWYNDGATSEMVGLSGRAVLYVDAFNQGAEAVIMPIFEQLGIEYDKYDYLDTGSSFSGAMGSTFSETGAHNPGGYGNNGSTVAQLLGYRLILFDLGSFGTGALKREDPALFSDWLTGSGHDVHYARRGMIFGGSGLASAMLHNGRRQLPGGAGADTIQSPNPLTGTTPGSHTAFL